MEAKPKRREKNKAMSYHGVVFTHLVELYVYS